MEDDSSDESNVDGDDIEEGGYSDHVDEMPEDEAHTGVYIACSSS